MSDLVEFLKARLDEVEQSATAASPGPWHPNAEGDEIVAVDDVTVADGFALSGRQLRATVDHIVRHDPARVLREVEAKRQLLQEVWTGMEDFAVNIEESRDGNDCGAREYRDQLLGILALPYDDHPDFQEAWRV